MEVEQHCNAVNVSVDCPLKTDGERFELDALMDDQRETGATVLAKLKEWLHHMEHVNEESFVEPFEPLRMTTVGAAGTGKSVLINTMVAAIQDMFDFTDSVAVFTPTGCAAFNVGGETIHHGARVPVRLNNDDV